jgi:hypothetical protein
LLAQEADARRKVVELEAEAEALRLERLEERLKAFPLAAQYEWESAQLEVARSLAGNPRAVVQVGNVGDVTRALVLGDLMRFTLPGQSVPVAPTVNSNDSQDDGHDNSQGDSHGDSNDRINTTGQAVAEQPVEET